MDLDDLGAIRADCDELLPDLCVIQGKTVVSDGGGGSTETFAMRSALKCRIAPLAGGERGGAGARASVGDQAIDAATHVVAFPHGTDVRNTDRLVVADQVYEVTLVLKRGASELTRRVEVKELP